MHEETGLQSVESPLRAAAAALCRYSKLFLAVLATVALLVLAILLFSPKQYRSETKFLFAANRSTTLIAPERSNGATGSAAITDQILYSELEVMNSDEILSAAADPEWSASGSSADATRQRLHEQRLRQFRKYFAVDLVRKSDVIVVRYTAHTPENAQLALARFSNAYLKRRSELSRPAGTFAFYAAQADRYKDSWQQASQALAAFQSLHEITSIEQAETTLSKQISSYEEDGLSNTASLVELKGRLAASQAALKQIPSRQQTQAHTLVNQTATEQMRTLLVQLENRRTELLTRYTPQNALVIEIDSEIKQTKASLAEALTQTGREDTTDINPVWQQVQSALNEGKIEQQSLGAKSAAINEIVSHLRARLIELQALDATFGTLQSKADAARSSYELFSEKRDQAAIEDEMDKHNLVDVAVVEKPTQSNMAVSPRPLLYSGMGLFTAILFATAAVYIAEVNRDTVSNAFELERVSRVPVLATFPLLLSKPQSDV